MIAFLLIILIAILLLGGQVVAGFIGLFMAGVAAIALCLWLGIDPTTFFHVAVGLFAVLVVFGLFANKIERWYPYRGVPKRSDKFADKELDLQRPKRIKKPII